MKVTYIKSILCMLDAIENDGLNLKSTINLIYEQSKIRQFKISISEIENIIQYFVKNKLLKDTSLGYDLFPLVTIYGHSSSQSDTEALSLLSCIMRFNHRIEALYNNSNSYKLDQINNLFDPITLSLFLQSSLIIKNKKIYRINERYIEYYQDLKTSDTNNLINELVLANYLKDKLAEMPVGEYTNVKNGIVPYKNVSIITDIIPQHGILKDRESVKAFQSFYKDCLFNDADHTCQICGLDFPILLIASHIKPYRDCGHMYETVDYNNGLLLCKNHDYLFDQGYISFNDDGSILISSELKKHPDYNNIYNIDENTKLRVSNINKNRKLFLAYHRSHIYKSSHK